MYVVCTLHERERAVDVSVGNDAVAVEAYGRYACVMMRRER